MYKILKTSGKGRNKNWDNQLFIKKLYYKIELIADSSITLLHKPICANTGIVYILT
mgnify:CR=1 FL=1